MKPQLTREQIKKHPNIHPEYKAQMLADMDKHDADIRRRVKIGIYIFAALMVILTIVLSGCEDSNADFERSQAELQWKLDSLEKARTTDGFQDDQQIQHDRDYNSGEINKLIIHHSK